MSSTLGLYRTLHDDDLCALLIEGDRCAFSTIFERYHSLLYNYSYKKIQNKEEAQDVVQHVFVSLWEKRANLPASVTLSAYLYTAVRNRSFDLFARKKVQYKYLNTLKEPSFICSDTDFLLRENEVKSLIEKEIEALPTRMQEIFKLSRMNKLTNKEIAELLDLSTHTIDTQIKRALKVLKSKLGPLYIFLTILY
jgi:RNA polymerase sigma-70 factor (family 1)